MRIEMVTPTLVAAGMEMVIARLTRGLAARGHDVGVTCIEYRGAIGEELAAQGYRVSVVPAPGLVPIVFPRALAAAFRHHSPDVVHVHSGAWIKAARAARLAGVARVVHTVHGLLDSEPWHGPWFKRWAARYTDAIATVSAPLRDYLVERAGVPRGSITIVPNGVDTDVYRPGPAAGRIRKQFGLGADSCIIGHVARFSAVKNHEMLLHAFARVVNEVPGAFLALAGDGPLRAAIEAMIRELGIESRVGLLGHMSEQVPSLYREFDVFVLPSLAEGTSMSILEAMASGVPVVATAVGGTPDVLDHGRSGVLVPSRDAEALAAALGALLRNPSERKRLGSASRQRIRELYSEEVVLSEYERLYTGGVAASSVAA